MCPGTLHAGHAAILMSLELPETVYCAIIDHFRSCLPFEGCGLIAGSAGRVSVYYPMTNTEQSSCSFLMDPAEQFQVMRSMRESGIEMLGICHSHPDGPAYPSENDVRMALYEDVAYLIVSFAEGELSTRAFRIAGGTVTAVPLLRI